MNDRRYYCFTGPARLNKGIHNLKGILEGVVADQAINETELRTLRDWLANHKEFAGRHPFNELFPVLENALSCNIVAQEDVRDVLWLCDKLGEGYYSRFTRDMQNLQGIIGGILSDGTINAKELKALSKWMEEHSHLKTIWPFDEMEAVVAYVLHDNMITGEEHHQLMSFLGEFADFTSAQMFIPPGENLSVSGVCSVRPEITFPGKEFCSTGAFVKGPRHIISEAVAKLGGVYSDMLGETASYLVIGSGGNPCWSYACYGRKVEKAVELRKKGFPLVIVRENDFWDAVRNKNNDYSDNFSQ